MIHKLIPNIRTGSKKCDALLYFMFYYLTRMLLTLKLSDRPTLLLVRISPLVDGFEVCCLDCPSSLSTKFFTECCGVSESNGTSKNVEGNVNKR